MGAFIIAAILFIGTVFVSLVVAFAEGMAAAPAYDNVPLYIFIGGCVLCGIIIASHWLPHIGW
jgi:uncharacterized membrane protein YdcZ (DUF606 family)